MFGGSLLVSWSRGVAASADGVGQVQHPWRNLMLAIKPSRGTPWMPQMKRTHAPAAALRRTLRLLLAVMLLGLLAAQETVNTEYMSHAPHRTDLPPECAQVYGLLERCRARVAGRNIVQRAFNALGYGGCGGLEAKVLSCARQYRDGVVDAPPHADSSHGQFSGDWARSEPEQLRAPPRRSRKDGLTPEVFHKEYLSKGRPVIVTDAAADWPALVRCAAATPHQARGLALTVPVVSGLGLLEVRSSRAAA